MSDNKFIKVINEELLNIIGEFDSIFVREDNGLILQTTEPRHLFKDFEYFHFDNDFWYLTKEDRYRGDIQLKIDNLDIFRQYVQKVITQRVVPYMVSIYNNGVIDELPPKINVETENNLDYSRITPEGFRKVFNSIADEYNDEIFGDVSIEETVLGRELRIDFMLDTNSHWGIQKHNCVYIYKRGTVDISLSEPLEDSELVYALEEELPDKLRELCSIFQ